MGLNRECMDKPYLIGRATAIVESLVDVPSDFVALVQVNPLEKLTYHLREAMKDEDDELIEIVEHIGELPARMIDIKGQFYVGYYHQKAEDERLDNRICIGQQIICLRRKRGLTQEQLAELSGLNRVNIAKIENGRYNVSIDILNKICKVLGAQLSINSEDETSETF